MGAVQRSTSPLVFSITFLVDVGGFLLFSSVARDDHIKGFRLKEKPRVFGNERCLAES